MQIAFAIFAAILLHCSSADRAACLASEGPAVPDQIQLSHSAGSLAINSGRWQSFVPAWSSRITAISLFLLSGSYSTGTVTINLYFGQGTVGDSLGSATVTTCDLRGYPVTCPAWENATFSTPVSVTAGQTYTFSLTESTSAGIGFSYGNPYASGLTSDAFDGGSSAIDFTFETLMPPEINSCTINNGGCGGETCFQTGHCTNICCNSGYSYNSTLGCVAVNNCVTDNGGCGPNSTCSSSGPGQNTCECDFGFGSPSNNGTDCMAINNCLNQQRQICGSYSTCQYTGPGTNTCSCNSGYAVGPGGSCAFGCMVSSDCGDNSNCSGGACSCNDGYFSQTARDDGRNCYNFYCYPTSAAQLGCQVSANGSVVSCSGLQFEVLPCTFPVDVVSLDMSNTSLFSLASEQFADLLSLETLDLSSNYLCVVPATLLWNQANLTSLSLQGNSLFDLDASFFANTSRLLYLDLSDTQLSTVRASWFRNLGELQVLLLSSCSNLQTIETSAFDTLVHLARLEMQDTQISELGPKLLYYNVLLFSLNAGSDLHTIYSDAFPSTWTDNTYACGVGTVCRSGACVQQCGTSSVCQDVDDTEHPFVSNITQFGCSCQDGFAVAIGSPSSENQCMRSCNVSSSCGVNGQCGKGICMCDQGFRSQSTPADGSNCFSYNCSTRSAAALGCFVNSSMVSCAGRQLSVLPCALPSTITELDLSHNIFGDFGDSQFDSLFSLETLDLAANGLTRLSAAWLADKTNLTRLVVSDNSIGDLADNVFENTTSLQSLDLSGTLLTVVRQAWFAHLGQLEYLVLSSCTQLTSIEPSAFDVLVNLVGLILEGSGLRSIPSGLFLPLVHLQGLDLLSTPLTSLDSDVFSSLTGLQLLGLPSQLRTIASDSFPSTWESGASYLCGDTQTHCNAGACSSACGSKSICTVGPESTLSPDTQFACSCQSGYSSLAPSASDPCAIACTVDSDCGTDASCLAVTTTTPTTTTSTTTSSTSTTMGARIPRRRGALIPVVASGVCSCNQGFSSQSVPSDGRNCFGYSCSLSTFERLGCVVSQGETSVFCERQQIAALPCSMPSSILSLDLSYNFILGIGDTQLSNLTSLQSLRLGFNFLTAVSSQWLASKPSLTTLSLINNPIADLDSALFSNSASLLSLDLSLTQLTTVRRSWFTSLVQLQTLLLNDISTLTVIESSSFDMLTSLSILSLGNTGVTSLPSGLFIFTTALTSLNVSFTPITSLASGVFSSCNALTLLVVGSQVESVASDAFPSAWSSNSTFECDSGHSECLSGSCATSCGEHSVCTAVDGGFLNSVSSFSCACQSGFATASGSPSPTNVCSQVCSPACNSTQTCQGGQCFCRAGAFVSGFSRSGFLCSLCSVGTFSPGVQARGCSLCVTGTFSNMTGSTSCANWTTCATGFRQIAAPSSSTDRVCQQIDACIDYPCSFFSSGCTDLPPPALNNAAGRTCGPCNTGYVSAGNGTACISNDTQPSQCNCAANAGWVGTSCGASDAQACYNASGVQTRFCGLDGIWGSPNTSACLSSNGSTACQQFPCDVNSGGCTLTGTSFRNSSDRVCAGYRFGYALQGSSCVNILLRDTAKENITAYNVVLYSTWASDTITQTSPNSIDVANTVAIVQKISQVTDAASLDILGSVAGITNQLVGTDPDVLMTAFNGSSDYSYGSYFSDVAAIQAMGLTPGVNQTIDLPNLSVINTNIPNFDGFSVTLPHLSGVDSVFVPHNVSSNVTTNATVSVIQYQSSTLFVDTQNNVTVGSSVVSLTIGDVEPDSMLDAPVTIGFQLPVNAMTDAVATCVYYDFHDLTWRTDGCSVSASNALDDTVSCTCVHLTNFAVLLDYSGNSQTLSSTNALVLGYITTVGLSISVILMGFVVLVYIFLPAFRTKPKTVVVNLCVCLIVAQILFLAGIDDTGSPRGCGVIAVFLQYFLLAAFMWMLREAVLLYETFVIVFGGAQIRWNRTFLACYGVPAVIVAISVGIRWSDYGTHTYCWLSTSHGTVWAFIAPLLAIVAVNAVVFVRIMFAVLSMRQRVRHSSSDEHERYTKLKKGFRASLTFLSLLGVTWVFGALAIGKAAVAFFYLFALCNVLQGVVIFVFQCALDNNVRHVVSRVTGLSIASTTTKDGTLQNAKKKKHVYAAETTHSTTNPTLEQSSADDDGVSDSEKGTTLDTYGRPADSLAGQATSIRAGRTGKAQSSRKAAADSEFADSIADTQWEREELDDDDVLSKRPASPSSAPQMTREQNRSRSIAVLEEGSARPESPDAEFVVLNV